MQRIKILIVCLVLFLGLSTTHAQQDTLEKRLLREGSAALAKSARKQGDAKRGAIVFYQRYLACTQCHRLGEGKQPLAPDLARMDKGTTDAYLVESVLAPSKVIKKEYQAITIFLANGKSLTGLRVKQTPKELTVRDARQNGKEVTIPRNKIDSVVVSKQSIMPAGQVNQLASRQQFLDLVRYLMELRTGGVARARELEPPPALYAAPPLPEYEKNIDHAGMISDLNARSFKRGQAIYQRLCINCHGTREKPGSLPTSLRFASGKFKSGSDPYTMYQTLTRGFGMMTPQTWMVPQQKYDVIHYIREAYLKPHNPSQYFAINPRYLARLPRGTTKGPAPTNPQPWVTMNYGTSLINTYQIPSPKLNFAYKGIAVRLDPGPGGVSRGAHWMILDHDTMRMAAAWSGKGFIDWQGIHFNGRHQIHPRVVGTVQVHNPVGPGWAHPTKQNFDDPRLVGRDDRKYGPLPRSWAHYKGLYKHGNKVIVSYTVGETDVLEMPGMEMSQQGPLFTRTFNIGPRAQDMILQVAYEPNKPFTIHNPHSNAGSNPARPQKGSRCARNKPGQARAGRNTPPVSPPGSGPGLALLGAEASREAATAGWDFDGKSAVLIRKSNDFEMRDRDYSILARIRTRVGGTIFSKAAARGEWVRNGKTLFVRGRRLVFDVGWVGMVRSRRVVADGQWHQVGMTYEHKTGRVRLYVDGKEEGTGRLKPRARVNKHVVRIGYTAPNFPEKQSFFKGDLADVRFYQRVLTEEEFQGKNVSKKALVGSWELSDRQKLAIPDQSDRGHTGQVVRGRATTATEGVLAAGLIAPPAGATWVRAQREGLQGTRGGQLRLKIPAGKEPLRFVLWMGRAKSAEALTGLEPTTKARDLKPLTHGGPRQWAGVVKTAGKLGEDTGPFAVDVLTRPVSNPWFCRVRLSGLDFYPDGKSAAVSSWDGDVWIVKGIDRPEGGLTWQRIASGLFQPLGVKIVDGQIHVTCRDQLVILRDLNGDGETDFYQNFNNDHQVTEHFHEFAMGLQRDAEGNFYYAKSARHAKTALVPHHGTLLRVSKDGSRTKILATGFRAANGVCLNPDGTFFVTDQEGHWTPKNRINWVQEGRFYGNMYGYHDVEDTSNSAMEPPLCWITNSFDRSPAELLWVRSKAWGPLNGALLNLSYGYGQVYVVPHEKIGGKMQGGMCALPIPRLPTGTMRGRFHPENGQLYTCGLFAWAGNQKQPGGFYRIRYTGKPVHLPVQLSARKRGLKIQFSGQLDPRTATDPENFAIKVWSLRRSARYGSKHYDEKSWKVQKVTLSKDGTTVFLEVPQIAPTWCMEIRYTLKGSGGTVIKGMIHNTIHELAKESKIRTPTAN